MIQQRWLILASVACGTFMATLDSSIVNVALPSITQSFHTGLSHSRWVVISYLFSITGLLLFFGKLADTLGRKTVFNSGFVIFVVGSLFCALAPTITQLIFARGLQGLGASMLMANGPAIITAAFPPQERGRALGTMAMVVSAGLAIGPTVGGLLLRFLGWPSIFLVNIPIGIVGAILVYRYVPKDHSEAPHKNVIAREHALPLQARFQLNLNKLRYFDWLGTFLWLFVQVGYSLVIDRENVLLLAPPIQKLFIVGSIGLLILFFLWESSIDDPVLDFSLFRSRIFRNCNISALFSVIGMSSITLLMPFYLQNIRAFPPVKVGVIMTSIPITIFIFAPVAGRLSDLYGSRLLSIIGITLISFSLLTLGFPGSGLTTDLSSDLIVAHLALAGAGFGIFQSPNSKAIMGDVKKSQWGVASALLATIRNFGLVTGTAFSSMLLMYFYSQKLSKIPTTGAEDFVTSLRETFLVLGSVCSLGTISSYFISSGEKQK